MSSVLNKDEEIAALNESINDLMDTIYEQAGEIQSFSARELGYKNIIRNLVSQGEAYLKDIERLREERSFLQK